mgnify:CR=1 FL=1|tara:strand:+ start:2497 stop:3117 length:621 start_codon:yes stop_codon:yes gene_type:complete
MSDYAIGNHAVSTPLMGVSPFTGQAIKLLPATTPNFGESVVNGSDANRTFGGSSAAHSNSDITGVAGGSRALAGAGFFNSVMYGQTSTLKTKAPLQGLRAGPGRPGPLRYKGIGPPPYLNTKTGLGKTPFLYTKNNSKGTGTTGYFNKADFFGQVLTSSVNPGRGQEYDKFFGYVIVENKYLLPSGTPVSPIPTPGPPVPGPITTY